MNGKRPGYLDGVYDAESLKPRQVPADGKHVEVVPVEEEDDLGYCAARPIAKNGYHALGVKRNGKRDRIFELSHLATSYEGDNERIDLVFAGNEKWVVCVHGRNLLRLLYFIKERRIDWIREATGNSGKFPVEDDGKPFITRIDLREVKEEES